MKNWEIMAVLERKQEDGESWACPALLPRNKRTSKGWPFKDSPPSPAPTAGNPAPVPPCWAIPRNRPPPPRHSDQGRPVIGRVCGLWRMGVEEDPTLRLARPRRRRSRGERRFAPISVGRPHSASPPFFAPRSETPEPANCCRTAPGSHGT